MKPVRSFTFLGKRWKYRRAAPKKADDHGKCEGPHIKDKVIVIFNGQTEFAEFETFIHEFLHACCWWLDEEYVHDIAHDIAKALWRLGFRRIKE
jgi:hypothetical protein